MGRVAVVNKMSSPSLSPDLVLFNARVITLNGRQPTAELVAIRGGRIVWVGSNGDLAGMPRRGSRAIDCQRQTIVPGFIDSHCHVMAYASSLLAVDCRPPAASSIADIKRGLRERAKSTPPGRWIRGTGYSEFALREKRHPSRWDLDEVVPNHPVRLNHQSGHACVLNTEALVRVGITKDTPGPMGGVVERDWKTGEPTGLLMEMDQYLQGLIPLLSKRELHYGVQLADQRLISLGITSVHDATHTNSPERWDTFRRLKSERLLRPRVTMMPGCDYLEGFLNRGLRFGSGDGDLSLGAIKVMLTTTTGTLRPSQRELQDIILRGREAGFQVAIHAVEAEAVEAAVSALTAEDSSEQSVPIGSGNRDRIEHCSECPPAELKRLSGSGLVVVTQPVFLYCNGRRYMSEVAEHMRPWLYRMSSFVEAELSLAAGSDAPVADPSPLFGMYAAVTRRAETGETIGESEGVSAKHALRMYTLNGAYASFQEADKGAIEVGKLADLVLLDQDPTEVEPEQIRNINVMMTVIGGEVVWQA